MQRYCGCALIAATIVAACGRAQPILDQGDPIAALFSGQAEWIDMSYAYDEGTIFWPTARVFEFEIVEAGTSDAGYYYAANSFCTAEHGGTHLDAPIHFGEGRQTVAEVPLDRLVGPAVVVDVSAAAETRPEYLVVPDDFEAWEGEHGRIPDGAIVLVRTGWGARWPDRGRYLGTTLTGATAVPELRFPGLHPEGARWLVENRRIDAVGIDTASIGGGERGGEGPHPLDPSGVPLSVRTHQVLAAEDLPAFENVAALDRLPPTGAYVVALPMKIGRGSGGPIRIVGVIPGTGG